MLIINGKNYYTVEELQQYAQAVATVAKYTYYNEYVENLENEFDELDDMYCKLESEYIELKENARRLKQVNTRLKKGQRNKESVFDVGDAERYRKKCIELLEEKKSLKRRISVLEHQLKYCPNDKRHMIERV